jgi:6-pyruvoyltetrahydropterin/6-carboxytetrahydropterin synthase
MYTLTVESQFSAAHFLVDYPGACKRVHGHNWKVKATILSEDLDDMGMVIDLITLDELLAECLERFDHHVLNEIEPFDKLNPTSEQIARYVFDWLQERLPAEISVKEVQVFETDNYSVSYFK